MVFLRTQSRSSFLSQIDPRFAPGKVLRGSGSASLSFTRRPPFADPEQVHHLLGSVIVLRENWSRSRLVVHRLPRFEFVRGGKTTPRFSMVQKLWVYTNMARASLVGSVDKRSVSFDVPVKRQPIHEDPPPQPVRPDLSSLDQLIGFDPSGTHVFLHLGNGHPFTGTTCDLSVSDAASAIALWSHLSSYQSVSCRYVARRYVMHVSLCSTRTAKRRLSREGVLGFVGFSKSHIQKRDIYRLCSLLGQFVSVAQVCSSGRRYLTASASMLKCELRPALSVPDVHRITTCAMFMLR